MDLGKLQDGGLIGESLEVEESPHRVIGLKSLESVHNLLHKGWIFIAATALSVQKRRRWEEDHV